ncbi:hypothetical protein DFS34DRAFT_655849 [Phlyctochytrium arcticum]|nr:hypothetical protein DFS34DRAFT_653043 [Phlyctochytrium arcticum]KAI9096869.1 hypothetical protein DFS34DRAFT_659846 [Phlyctochytrium arcticum]KAI9105525.1 hypothetical protein DFS34DRAFT_655822 [Phlyctochytrium arcticum]KAI9105529.1 hypothetical protein DFS34DRAFT_655849 [Phlyctochytrium arcticum]
MASQHQQSAASGSSQPITPNRTGAGASSFMSRLSLNKRKRTVSTDRDHDSDDESGVLNPNTDTPTPPNGSPFRPTSGFPLSVQSASALLQRLKVDRQLEHAGIQFAAMGMGEQLLSLFVAIEKLNRKVVGVQTSEIQNFEVNPSLKANIKKEVRDYSQNPFKTRFYKESVGVTDKLFDDELGVAANLKTVESIYKTVQTAVSDEFAQVKTRMKKAILGGPGGEVSTCPLVELANDIFGVDHSPDQKNRAAVMRTFAQAFTFEEASPHKFWESMTNALTELEAEQGVNLASTVEEMGREDEVSHSGAF